MIETSNVAWVTPMGPVRGRAVPPLDRRRGARSLTRRPLRVPVAMAALSGLTLVLGVLATAWPSVVPLTVLIVPLVLGGLLLTWVPLVWLVAAIVVMLAVGVMVRGPGIQYFLAVIVFLVVAGMMLALGRSRTRLGVLGTTGESMLVDLRDRLAAQGELPPLPRGWAVEVATRSAEGAAFSGDFVVSAATTHPDRLEVALVDVSGKGLDAGTRSLLLSGAFGGLLGSLSPGEFLVAANAYLQRQEWSEGFATAVHVVVDLTDGRYEARTAGHPPLIHYHAGSGRWDVVETAGVALGVQDSVAYDSATGVMRRGDALLLYTDGVVESPRRELTDGIDWLQGQAERLVTSGFRHGARTLVDAVGSSDDDRALLMLWRT